MQPDEAEAKERRTGRQLLDCFPLARALVRFPGGVKESLGFDEDIRRELLSRREIAG